MAGGLLLLLDDIASVLDDVATLTKVAVQKTSGVLGDDLALNAQQVSGVQANRELPIVWAVAKGSLFNKAILVPAAILLSALAPWAITPLLIIGGAYLCFEGVEKIVHSILHRKKKPHALEPLVSENVPQIESSSGELSSTGGSVAHELTASKELTAEEITKIEKEKIAGAIRTDFILSAEIIVITLGTIADANFVTRISVLVAIALVMTAGVYGLVAGIVKLDDLGKWLLERKGIGTWGRTQRFFGLGIFSATPYLMKGLSIAGTAAMFLVGGGILVHGIPMLHHWEEHLVHPLEAIQPALTVVAKMVLEAVVGIIAGAIVLLFYMPFKPKEVKH